MAKKKDKSTAMERYIAEIDRFADLLRRNQDVIRELETELLISKAAYDKAREAVKEQKEIEHGTVSLLLKFIRPGSIDVLPLFDTMEEANEEVHGTHADEWRKEPIAVLDLSAAAMRALIDADVVLVGQLQDRILKGTEWGNELGLSVGIAQAIEAKLKEFIQSKGGK